MRAAVVMFQFVAAFRCTSRDAVIAWLTSASRALSEVEQYLRVSVEWYARCRTYTARTHSACMHVTGKKNSVQNSLAGAQIMGAGAISVSTRCVHLDCARDHHARASDAMKRRANRGNVSRCALPDLPSAVHMQVEEHLIKLES